MIRTQAFLHFGDILIHWSFYFPFSAQPEGCLSLPYSKNPGGLYRNICIISLVVTHCKHKVGFLYFCFHNQLTISIQKNLPFFSKAWRVCLFVPFFLLFSSWFWLCLSIWFHFAILQLPFPSSKSLTLLAFIVRKFDFVFLQVQIIATYWACVDVTTRAVALDIGIG